jgi:ubiquinone biosynthesis protein Coq4
MEALKRIERSYYKYRGQAKFLGLVKNPQDTQSIFEMNNYVKLSQPPEQIARLMSKVYSNPLMQQAYEEKYWPEMPTMQELKSMPEGSFGKEFANFFEKWNLDLEFYPEPHLDTPQDYLLSRVYQAHDAWHVLTGYTPGIADELALQAFGVAQYEQPISTLIITGGLMHFLQNDPESAVEALAKITKGYERGKKAANLLTSPVLERFAEPLDVVRRDLNIEV